MKNRRRYPDNWFDTIRPAVLKRDGYKCTVCGALNHKRGYYTPAGAFVHSDAVIEAWAVREGVKIKAVHLQIAHLDQNPDNNDLSNLRTFCPKHHFEYDHEFNRLKRISNAKHSTG